MRPAGSRSSGAGACVGSGRGASPSAFDAGGRRVQHPRATFAVEFAMCRYGLHNYKDHFACFACRKVYRKAWSALARQRFASGDEHDAARSVCPQCAGRMAKMGLDFKAPPQNDVEAWRIVERLYARGLNFGSCGCGGPGYTPPKKLSGLPAWFAQRERPSPGAALLAKIEARSTPPA